MKKEVGDFREEIEEGGEIEIKGESWRVVPCCWGLCLGGYRQ